MVMVDVCCSSGVGVAASGVMKNVAPKKMTAKRMPGRSRSVMHEPVCFGI